LLDARKEEIIQQQIQGWLAQEENLEIMSSGEDMRHRYFFSWRVQRTELRECNVNIENNVERVNIITNVNLPGAEIAANRIIVNTIDFLGALELNLEERGARVQVVATPDIEHLDGLQFGRVISFDELTRDGLIDAIQNVIDSIDLAQDLFARFSTT
jgi:hypothetical protein